MGLIIRRLTDEQLVLLNVTQNMANELRDSKNNNDSSIDHDSEQEADV